MMDVQARLERLDALLSTEANRNNDSLSNLAKIRDIMNAKAVLATFRIGGLEGQTGQAMSNKDFERLKNTFETTDPATYKKLSLNI